MLLMIQGRQKALCECVVDALQGLQDFVDAIALHTKTGSDALDGTYKTAQELLISTIRVSQFY